MSTCDGQFEPKSTAPPSWVLTPDNFYNGKLLDIFAGIYAAKELAGQVLPGTQNQEYTSRKNKWLDLLSKIKLPPQQNTRIIDLGLTLDLCHQGRPIEPDIPSLTPQALANGSVGNAVAELYKAQLFDQWCECRPRDRPAETCECQRYVMSIRIDIIKPNRITGSPFNYFAKGKLSSLTTISGNTPNTLSVGFYSNLGCGVPPESLGLWNEMVSGTAEEVGKFDVVIISVTKQPGAPVIDCNPKPPDPPPPPYIPGLPPGYDINLPPELPQSPPSTWGEPKWFIPVNVPFGIPTFPTECPPSEKCEYMYWTIENKPTSIIYSDTPPPSGVVVFGTSDTVDFDVSFAIIPALADQSLRSWRKRTQPADIDTTFINVANIYLMIDGVAIGDGEEMNVPRMRMRVPFEYRDRQKAIKIMPKGINTPIVVADSGNRWISKKFPVT